MVLLHGTLDVVIYEATDLPLSFTNQVRVYGGAGCTQDAGRARTQDVWR
jgi:hypothetical protein